MKFNKFCALYEKEIKIYFENLGSSHPDICADSEEHAFLNRHIQPSDNVLEIGCGLGNYTFDISKLSKSVDAIDFVEKYVDEVKKMAAEQDSRNVHAYKMSVHEIPSFQKNYDKIFFGRTLSQLPDPKASIGLAGKKLKEKGKIILIEGEIYPDPSGSFYPVHFERARKICSLLNYDVDEVSDFFLIPFMVDDCWVEKLAGANDMKIDKKESLNIFFYFDQKIKESMWILSKKIGGAE